MASEDQAHDKTATSGKQLPPLWEIEWRVVDIACSQLALDREAVTPESRLFEDLNFDSLDAVEFTMELEEHFDITLSDADCQEWFVNQAITLHSIAELVVHRWGTGKANRSRWQTPRSESPKATSVPVTQLGGTCSPKEWLDGQLYEFIGENREGYRQFRRRTDGMRCLLIPSAEVTIGNPNKTAPEDQQPAHRVELTEFLIDAEPITNLAFCRFLNSVDVPLEIMLDWCGVGAQDKRGTHLQIKKGLLNRSWSPVKSTEQLPMMLVSWFGANAYSLWANRQDWRLYRVGERIPQELEKHERWQGRAPREEMLSTSLPSEAQWEYAARGATPKAFPWGDEPATNRHARLARHQSGMVYTPETIPSACVNEELGKSPFGLHHMAGNVWQWCRDWYSPNFYSEIEATRPNPQNAQPGTVRSERGGSWVGPEELSSSYYRRGRPPATRGRCLGFRCVGSVKDLP